MSVETSVGIPDLFSDAVIADPFPAYRELRDFGVVLDGRNSMWVAARHRDVLEAIHHPSLYSSQLGFEAFMSGVVGPAGPERAEAVGFDQVFGSRVLIASDPPTHTELRRVVSRPFTKRSIGSWEPWARLMVEELVDELLEKCEAGDADLVRDLAIPLPVRMIAEMLGVPSERMEDFRRWSEALVGSLAAEVDLEAVSGDLADMFAFFSEVTEDRRRDPGEDLISMIAAATPEGETLTSIEVVMFCVLLLVAGNETTTNLLGSLQMALWEHPGQLALLRDRPELVGAAVEEGLRFGGPVQGLFRQTTEPCQLGGVDLPAGANVLVAFASANRDERVFDEPDVFRVERDSSEHLALGHGIHYCLGAQLARLETRLVLEALLERGIDLEPAGECAPTHNPILRGFLSMPVALSSASGGRRHGS